MTEANRTDNERLKAFKSDLLQYEAPIIIRKHITSGSCFLLDDSQYFHLRQEIASRFSIHPSEIVIVGSGKLGFSIKREKRYVAFGEDSDVDVAIISPYFFELVWKSVHDFRVSKSFWPQEEMFRKYLFRGWIRPDKLPPSSRFAFADDWWTFFTELSRSGRFGDYKIVAGLYQSWYFLESYQSINVIECIDEARAEYENNSN